MQKLKGLLGLAVIGLMVPLLGGCNDQLKNENAALRVQNQAAMERLSEAEADRARLEEQIIALRSDTSGRDTIARQEQLIATLQSERDTLRGYYDQLQIQYKALVEKMAAAGAVRGGSERQLDPATRSLLRELEKNYSQYFSYDEQAGRLRFSSDVTFASGSATVSSQVTEALGKLAQILNQEAASEVIVSVYGHTDDVPVRKPETVRLFKNNMGLSVARADAVAKILAANGVAQDRITTKGFGETQPISKTEKARNRRVEIYLTMPL